MSDQRPQIDPLFHKQVKDVLEHLYDTAYLETHPLSDRIALPDSGSRVTRAQKLRSQMKDLIETLRPQEGPPGSLPEWRSYRALHCRYVQGMNMGQVEHELGISLRQLQRELRKGSDAITSLLWQQVIDRGVTIPAAIEPEEAAVPEELRDLEAELNQWVFQRRSRDVRMLLEDVIWMLSAQMEQREIDTSLQVPSGLPEVMIDTTLSRQALYKLLRLICSNTTGLVSIRAYSSGINVTVEIKAPGPCIDTQEGDWRIAEMLFQRQGADLSFCEPGEQADQTDGCRLAITLPRADQRSVLVVDDNPAIHQLFDRYLLPNQYTVIHALSGTEGLHLAAEKRPNFITLDVMMAAVDGWQVLRELKQNPSTQAIPVIVCSVLREPDLALSLGAGAYLKKPVERLHLLETLERLRQAEPGGSSLSGEHSEELQDS